MAAIPALCERYDIYIYGDNIYIYHIYIHIYIHMYVINIKKIICAIYIYVYYICI